MKTLILYETKTGYTKGCAEFLHKNIENSEMLNIHSNLYKIEDYDQILVGAPIYIGELEYDNARFFFTKEKQLLKKRLGIFCAGMNKAEFNLAIQSSLPPNVFYHAEIVHCGGKIEYDTLSRKEKKIVRKRLGITDSKSIDNVESMQLFLKWARNEI